MTQILHTSMFMLQFYCMEDDLSGYFTANWKNWEKKILESGLGKKYSTVETVHELPCSCKKTQNHNQAARLGLKVGEWLHFTSPLFGSQCWCCWSRHWCRLCWSTGTGMSWKKKGEPATIDLYKRKIRQESQDTVTIQIIFDFWSSN